MDQLPEQYGTILFTSRITETFMDVLKSEAGGKWKFWVWLGIEAMSGLIQRNDTLSQLSRGYTGG